jgi:hypothetical protein
LRGLSNQLRANSNVPLAREWHETCVYGIAMPFAPDSALAGPRTDYEPAVTRDSPTDWRPLAACALALAALVATASLGGILMPSIYARETPSWAAQGEGQDWFDLVVVVPLLIGIGNAGCGSE